MFVMANDDQLLMMANDKQINSVLTNDGWYSNSSHWLMGNPRYNNVRDPYLGETPIIYRLYNTGLVVNSSG